MLDSKARDLRICSFTTVWCDRVPRLCGLASLMDRLQKPMEEHCKLENQDRDPFAFVRKVMLLMKHVAARERLQAGMEGLNSECCSNASQSVRLGSNLAGSKV